MESVIFDETPLAAYLRDEGQDQPADWVPAADSPSAPSASSASESPASPESPSLQQQQRKQNMRRRTAVDTPPPSPPSPSFAPVGRPMVRKRFRNKIPNPLNVPSRSRASLTSSLSDHYTRAVASTMSRADSAQFLEQFRYTIITSHLLGPEAIGQHRLSRSSGSISTSTGASAGGTAGSTAPPQTLPVDLQATANIQGLVLAVAGAFVLSWAVKWAYTGSLSQATRKRALLGVLAVTVVLAVAGNTALRQQRLRNVRLSAMAGASTFVSRSQDFDSAMSAAISFIKEVELVSRGYRISAPLPPISRMDDQSQSRRCMRLRTAVRTCFKDALPVYTQANSAIQGFVEQLDLETYYHIYDISDFDISDALQGFAESDFSDMESLRTLNIAASRFHTIRRILLCALLTLACKGDESDALRWTTAVEALRSLNETTLTCYTHLQRILGEMETFPQMASPKVPLSPGRERWRSQLGKLNSLSTGIRGLQAKLALLREESDRTLNEADDITQLGPNLMAQYESIGQDLRLLIQAWEEGKSALASGIDRNEKRLSSISAILSPTISLSGLTTVGENGTAEDALQALTGGVGSPLGGSTVGDPEEEVVFEAMSLPPVRPKSLLTREERLAKMKEERERRAEAREQADASKGMLRELEMVINLRPKTGRGDC